MVEHIDLFAAETGFALSEIGYLLETRLTELIRSRIHTEVDRRIDYTLKKCARAFVLKICI